MYLFALYGNAQRLKPCPGDRLQTSPTPPFSSSRISVLMREKTCTLLNKLPVVKYVYETIFYVHVVILAGPI